MVWKWLSNKWKSNKIQIQLQEEEESLLQEIEQAKQDWHRAHDQLNHAVGKEQIDYAIFALEAAEKRYEMLLKQAKDMDHNHIKKEPVSFDGTIQKGEPL